MTQFHGNLRGIDGRQVSGHGCAAEASADRRSERARRNVVRDADGVGNRQIGHPCVDHRHKHARSQSCQRSGPANLVHKAMRTACMVILLRIATIIRTVSTVVVPVDICSDRVLGGMQFADLTQYWLDHQPKHQQRQNAGAEQSRQAGKIGFHSKRVRESKRKAQDCRPPAASHPKKCGKTWHGVSAGVASFLYPSPLKRPATPARPWPPA